VSAASPLRAQTARAVHSRLGVRVLQGYGLTETTNFSTTMPRGLDPADYDALALNAEIPSIGVALHGNSVAVLDADGRPLGPGAVGELCVRGQNVMLEYATNAAATAEAFRGGWFHTQDLGFYRSHAGQQYFFLTGRTKNIAKVGGESVSLEEMERLLQSVPGIIDAACAAFPDKLFGDVIVAAAVWRDGAVEPNWSAALQATFQPALHPREVVRLSEIPRTATGKIRRQELSAILANRTRR
jgi:acyl-CoA synthetase (AMP-forming)/AMP-acid ligase II